MFCYRSHDFCLFIHKQKIKVAQATFIFWQGQEDSNPRPTVLETGTLPAELYPYIVPSFDDCDIISHKKEKIKGFLNYFLIIFDLFFLLRFFFLNLRFLYELIQNTEIKTMIRIRTNQVLVMKLFIISIANKNPFRSTVALDKIGIEASTIPFCETVRTPTSSP